MNDVSGRGVSILFPGTSYDCCRVLPDVCVHDLGLDAVCEKLSEKPEEQQLFLGIMSRLCSDPQESGTAWMFSRISTAIPISATACWRFWIR